MSRILETALIALGVILIVVSLIDYARDIRGWYSKEVLISMLIGILVLVIGVALS